MSLASHASPSGLCVHSFGHGRQSGHGLWSPRSPTEVKTFSVSPSDSALTDNGERQDGFLAATAIADALANDGKPDDIEVAEELKAEGDEATESDKICDEAIDKYEEAWEKAVKSWCESE